MIEASIKANSVRKTAKNRQEKQKSWSRCEVHQAIARM